jgi:hypothetical protein
VVRTAARARRGHRIIEDANTRPQQFEKFHHARGLRFGALHRRAGDSLDRHGRALTHKKRGVFMKNSNSRARQLTKADFKLPLALVFLSLVPTFGGIARLVSVARHTAISASNARFVHSPVPVVIHIISATSFCMLGAFQFSRHFRVRWPGWHRRAGRVLALCGLLAGATGLWMTALYEIPKSLQGPLLYEARLTVATAMIACIVISWRSILRRDVARHEAFMIRAYALGQGAGTQVFVLLPWMLISGEAGGVTRDILMTLSWLINILVAEAIIRWRLRASGKTAPALSPGASPS